MTTRHPRTFRKQIPRQIRRRVLSVKRPASHWRGLGAMGMVGWSVAAPTLAGALLGQWLDAQGFSESSWTLMLMLAGLVAGCWNAAMWLGRERRSIQEDSQMTEHQPESLPESAPGRGGG